MALRRTKGGAWERVTHDVAPFADGATSQCEPEIIYDNESELFYLFFVQDDGSGGGGTFVRSSDDPELFRSPGLLKNERLIAPLPVRVGLSYDPYDTIYRFSLDSYDSNQLLQSWASSLATVSPKELAENSMPLHDSHHDLHPEFHPNKDAVVSQSANPFFLGSNQVVFFYSAMSNDAILRIYAQPCTRR